MKAVTAAGGRCTKLFSDKDATSLLNYVPYDTKAQQPISLRLAGPFTCKLRDGNFPEKKGKRSLPADRLTNVFIYRLWRRLTNLPGVCSSTEFGVISKLPSRSPALHLRDFKGAHLTGHEIIISSKENKRLNE